MWSHVHSPLKFSNQIQSAVSCDYFRKDPAATFIFPLSSLLSEICLAILLVKFAFPRFQHDLEWFVPMWAVFIGSPARNLRASFIFERLQLRYFHVFFSCSVLGASKNSLSESKVITYDRVCACPHEPRNCSARRFADRTCILIRCLCC